MKARKMPAFNANMCRSQCILLGLELQRPKTIPCPIKPYPQSHRHPFVLQSALSVFFALDILNENADFSNNDLVYPPHSILLIIKIAVGR